MDAATTSVTAVTFPDDDHVFAERVRHALREWSGSPENVADYLEARLSEVHPRVTVRLRSTLAGFGASPVVYVFRDGSATPPPNNEFWIGDPGTALLVTDAAGIYIEATDAAATLFGVPREEIIGKPAGTFTKPDVRLPDPGAMWRVLERTGRLHSLAIVAPAGAKSTSIPVEFITIRNGAGEGRHLTMIRALR